MSAGLSFKVWKKIVNILETYLFFPMDDGQQQKDMLLKMFQQYRADNNGKLDWEYFKSQLCYAYYSNNDKSYMFYDILSNKLHYSLNKRHQFYHILLHHYLKLSDLNKQNTIQILFKLFNIKCQNY
eukprot:194626_1